MIVDKIFTDLLSRLPEKLLVLSRVHNISLYILCTLGAMVLNFLSGICILLSLKDL